MACSNQPDSIVKNNEVPTMLKDSLSTDTLEFPESWLGNWIGELEIYKSNKVVQIIPMELELLAVDSMDNFVWAIIYGEDREAGRRAYELETLDAEKGLYLVDEKNTIKLEAYLFDNKLMSWYDVMGNKILSIQEKRGDEMIFEIVFGSSEPVSTTGGKAFQGEEIPIVKTFPIGGYQRALLRKK